MTWYRVEITSSGIVSARRCDGPHSADGAVYYVRAETVEVAKQMAIEMRRQDERERVRRQRANRYAEGRCRCGRERDRQGLKTCSVCSERSKRVQEARRDRNNELRRARRRNEPPPPYEPRQRDEQARVATNLRRQRDRQAEIRLTVLLEVKRQLDTAFSNACFRRWLLDEIASLTGRKAEAAE